MDNGIILESLEKAKSQVYSCKPWPDTAYFPAPPRPFWELGQWLKGLRWSFAFFPRMLQAHAAFVFLADHSD